MIRVAIEIGRHPSLWVTALRQARRVARPGWWHRPPFAPLPVSEYVRFRVVTQYGDERHPLDPHDVLNYLRWCKQWDAG